MGRFKGFFVFKAGSGRARPGQAGSGRARPSQAEPGRVRPSQAGARPSQAEHSKIITELVRLYDISRPGSGQAEAEAESDLARPGQARPPACPISLVGLSGLLYSAPCMNASPFAIL